MMEKQNAGDIRNNSDFLKFLDNFWYHYKFHTIMILFIALVIIVCSVQMCSNDNGKDDVTVVYAGTCELRGNTLEGVRGALNAVVPQDANDDGQKYTGIYSYQIYPEDKLKAILAEGTEEAHDAYVYFKSISTNEYETYSNIMATGEVSVCLLDPYLYEQALKGERLRNIEEVLGYLPDNAVGEYGIKLSETELYKVYESLQVLPDDTVLCLCKPYIIGASSKEKNYSVSVEMFKSIVNYKG